MSKGDPVSSPLLDEELRQILVLRWQLCEADLPPGEDLPYSAAWTRAQLTSRVLTEIVGRVNPSALPLPTTWVG